MKYKWVIKLGLLSLIAGVTVKSVEAYYQYPEGGEWSYGYGAMSAYSKYYHPSRHHSATVTNRSTGRTSHSKAYPGHWANAVVSRTGTQKATFYYNCW